MLRLAFAGTPEFAARALAAIVAAGHQLAFVLAQPDRPAGRGRSVQSGPVKALASSLGLEVWQPASLRDAGVQQRIALAGLDAMVVAAYGLILPPAVLAAPRSGCLNIHASLLPRWRGAAPIQRAIEAGDTETGITIMQMDAGLDTGPMLLSARTPIGPDDTGGSLHDRLAGLGAQAIVDALARLEAGDLQPIAQPVEGASYARKLDRSDSILDFAAPARTLVDRIRAFDPVPAAVAMLDREPPVPIRLWRARAVGAPGGPVPGTVPGAAPGTVLRADGDTLLIACGDGAIAALELQRPGGRRLSCGEFLRGFPLSVGERFVL